MAADRLAPLLSSRGIVIVDSSCRGAHGSRRSRRYADPGIAVGTWHCGELGRQGRARGRGAEHEPARGPSGLADGPTRGTQPASAARVPWISRSCYVCAGVSPQARAPAAQQDPLASLGAPPASGLSAQERDDMAHSATVAAVDSVARKILDNQLPDSLPSASLLSPSLPGLTATGAADREAAAGVFSRIGTGAPDVRALFRCLRCAPWSEWLTVDRRGAAVSGPEIGAGTAQDDMPGDLISAHATLAEINERVDRLRVAIGVLDKLITDGAKVGGKPVARAPGRPLRLRTLPFTVTLTLYTFAMRRGAAGRAGVASRPTRKKCGSCASRVWRCMTSCGRFWFARHKWWKTRRKPARYVREGSMAWDARVRADGQAVSLPAKPRRSDV